ncbi:MAG: ATPase central domain-containing protein, partial [Chloroflexi bacterium OLB15]
MSALDPALLRPGRFDKKIRIDAPDLEGRRDIIEYYVSKMSHDESIDPLTVANETPFYTPADLKYLLNESLRYALFEGRTYMSMRDIRMAQPEHEYGVRSPIKNLAAEDKYRLAAHEGGHAIAVRLFTPEYRIARITIIRQGGAHGYVRYYPATEDYEYTSTYDTLMNRLRVAAGGKAGEMEFCGDGSQTLGVGVGWGGFQRFWADSCRPVHDGKCWHVRADRRRRQNARPKQRRRDHRCQSDSRNARTHGRNLP